MSDTTRAQLIARLHATREDLAYLARATERAKAIEEGGETRTAYDVLMDRPLEVKITRSLHVVITTGGPHLELVVDLADSGALIDAYSVGAWGSERLELPVLEGSSLWVAAEQFAEAHSALPVSDKREDWPEPF